MAQKYGQTICSAINEKRTNIQSALQKVYIKRYCSGLPMPTHKELKDIVMRKGLDYIDTERKEGKTDEKYAEKLALAKKNERNRDFFIWYWLELVPTTVKKGNWNRKIRFLAQSRTMRPWIAPTISMLPPVMRH